VFDISSALSQYSLPKNCKENIVANLIKPMAKAKEKEVNCKKKGLGSNFGHLAEPTWASGLLSQLTS